MGMLFIRADAGCDDPHSLFLHKGAFDSFEHEHLPRTKYDQIIDETSNKPGEQAFEVRPRHPSPLAVASLLTVSATKKLISGRYLGEILRLVICELIDEGVLFLGQNTYKIEIPYALDTAFLSLMEMDPTEELLMIIGIFTHFFALETTLAERQFFRALAKLVGRRAARLSSCGIAAIVSKMGYLEAGCSVGADGSLYNVRPVCLIGLIFSRERKERERMELMVPRFHTEIPRLRGSCA
jgi:hexokinase